MRKNIAEDKEKLKEKLSYIGLNLERLPKFLTEFNPFSFLKSSIFTVGKSEIASNSGWPTKCASTWCFL